MNDKTKATWWVCLLLVGITLVAYLGVFSAGFVDYDDPYYVGQNLHIQAGLSWDGLCWAATTRDCDNWHPVTWLSLMVDSSVFGTGPAGFHATNLALHILNTLFLFLVLQRMTGARWRSAWVAALFAVHPLHVESVAWVAERKDVLSTFFLMLSLWAYVRHVEMAKSSCPAGVVLFRTRFYAWSLIFFALGLMAKPMLVTLPILLLLLDFWPLNRMGSVEPGVRNLKMLLWEKLPFCVLSAVSCVLTVWAQTQAMAMAVPLEYRLLNAALSYVRYVVKLFWPEKLYVNYPYPQGWAIWYPAVAVLLLVGISVLAIRVARKRPYIFTGWFWFLIALVPVIGLVQVGIQSIADRYMYVPMIGLLIVFVWLGCDLAEKWRVPPLLLRAVAVGLVAACIPVTMKQVGYWKDSFTLFEHALRLNPNNFLVQVNLAMSYEAKDHHDPALEHLVKATKINPYFGETYNKIGGIQLWRGQYAEAIEAFETALQLNASAPLAHYGLAIAYEKQGKWVEATEHIQATLALQPGNQEYIQEYNLILKKGARPPADAASPPQSHP